MDEWGKWIGLIAAILVAGMLRDVIAFARYVFGCRLHEAAKLGQTEKVERLLAGERDVDRLDPRLGFAPLHYAFRNGHVEAARLLLLHGADLGVHSATGETPLDLARRFLGTEDLRRALTVGGRPNSTDALGRTSLHLFARAGDDERVALLLAEGAHPDVEDARGVTPLFLATLAGEGGIGKLLIESGADVNRVNHDGTAPLAVAAGIGHVGLLRLLLAHGATADRRERDGWTALHYAGHQGHVEAARVLLDHGARTDLLDGEGRTPRDLAESAGKSEIVALLAERERGRDGRRRAEGASARSAAPAESAGSDSEPPLTDTAFRPAVAATSTASAPPGLGEAWLAAVGGGILGVFLLGLPLYGLGIWRREAVARFFGVAAKDAWRPLGLASALLGFTLFGVVVAPRNGVRLTLLALAAGAAFLLR